MKKLVLVLALIGIATPAAAQPVSPVAVSEAPTLVNASSTDHLFEGKPVLIAQAEPDAGIVIPPPPADTASPPARVVLDTQPTILQQLKELQAAYRAAKDNTDKSARMLLWAGAIATALKFLLDLLGRLAGGKTWMPLVALGMAVPIGLLSHFAAGHSWFDSILVAGAGPGAVFVHELIKRFTTKKPAEASK
jgi:hypothetical protein